MEFWGVEVKPGQSLKVDPEMGKLIHISQAALGEVKDSKGAKNVPLRLKIDDKKFIIGTLATEDRTQMMFDLVFEREFELSHDWKNGSVYFIGYMAEDPISDGEGFSDDSEDESEDEMLEAQENGEMKEKPVAVKAATKTESAGDKAVVKKEEKQNLGKVHEDDDDSDEEMGDEDDSSDEQDLEEEDEENSSEEEEELPKKSKKRAAEPAEGTPVAAKKSKSSTPDKKAHVATPFPSKPGKTPVSNKAKKEQASGPTCKSCSKTFNSEKALESHSKAKHGGK